MHLSVMQDAGEEGVIPTNRSLKSELCSTEISILVLTLSCSGDRKGLIF